jgi:hypothetical protein
MRRPSAIGGTIVAALLSGTAGAMAGPWQDEMAAYNRGDYVSAIRLLRPLAEAGNSKAQSLMGTAQSRELDKDKRRKIVFDIECLLVDDAARPIILHSSAGNCWQPT